MSDSADPATPGRVDAIDLVRGLVMVIMLLDHTRDFTHMSGVLMDPTDVARTTPVLFFTRWITHLCAPTFVFLAGTSTGIQRIRGTTPAALSRFLWTRGLWLILLELTVVRLVTWWDVAPTMLAMLQVIWAIGVAMIVLAALVRLPLRHSMRTIGVAGVVIVATHNLLDAIRVPGFQGPQGPVPSTAAKLWMVFHQGGIFPITGFPSPIVLALYPILPWIGVMLAGYGFAALYAWDSARRRRALFQIAGVLATVFLVLRIANVYGDPRPWSPQPTTAKTIISFFNVEKYGPSLLFTCATLAWSILLLAITDARALTSRLSRAFVTFGRVPMFFYVLQWITAHIAGLIVAAIYGRGFAYFFRNPVTGFGIQVTEFGGPLWLTYVCWITGAVLLYFPCRWYADLKARRRDLVLLRYF